jgi:hypothetical protein
VRVRLLIFVFFVGVCVLVFQSTVHSETVPNFKFFKMKVGGGLVSLVVPPDTSEKELIRLVKFIRSKVQHGKFSELGIQHATSKRHGKLGYDAGIIIIYRGNKCADEQFIDALGPCGYGEHDAASYQWGVNGDPKKDEGVLRQSNGDLRKLF